MIGEFKAASTAMILEAKLKEALDSDSEEVKNYAKNSLYKWYVDECNDSYGIINPNHALIKAFGDF